MTRIEAELEPDADGWLCRVRLSDARSDSEHHVRVRRADLDRLDPGASDPVDLVRRSFEFLLSREPKESILRAFDLTVIGRYFPEYETAIHR